MTRPCSFCGLLQTFHDDPTFIAEFPHSIALLNFDQDSYPGASILLLKEHHEHLHLIPVRTQQDIIPEFTALTKAIVTAFGTIRANHLSLGNQVAHVHWHIIPRHPGDHHAGFAPQYIEAYSKLSEGEYRETAKRIKNALVK